jgi:general secretion pathway protein A
VQHRLTVAGGDPGLFAPEALRMVSVASGGIPRVINTICDLAMVYGFSERKSVIDIGVINGVLEDRERMGLAGVAPPELDLEPAFPPLSSTASNAAAK